MKLWILRHAKAEAHSDSGRDQDRPLASAGQRACLGLNRWLKQADLAMPEKILVSPARRTRETAELALKDSGAANITICQELWLAGTRDLAGLIDEHGRNGIDSLMLIGHNPGLEDLVRQLGGHLPVHGLKPGTLVVMNLALPLRAGSAETDQLVEARDFT